MHTKARSGATTSSLVSENGIGGDQVNNNSNITNGVGMGIAYSAEEAECLGLVDLQDLNGPFPHQPFRSEWLLNGEEPPTYSSDDVMKWLQKAYDSPEMSSQKRNLVYALDIIAKGYAKNRISLSNVPSGPTSVSSANGTLYPASFSNGGSASHRGLRDTSPGPFEKTGMTSSIGPVKSKDMTDIQVLVKMQEEELRMSYQNRENAGNNSFLIRRDSQDSLDDTTMQAEIDYRLYQQPNRSARRRSRTHSRDRGPVTERNWDFVGLGNAASSMGGGSSPQLEKSASGKNRSRSRASAGASQERYQNEVSGTYGQMRSTMGVPTVKRKSNREMLEEASRARAAANQKSANRDRQGTYNARGSQEVVTGSGDFAGIEFNETMSAPPPLPMQARSRRRSYSVEHYNPQAPAINSRNNSQENLQQVQRVESRESLPGTKPAVRGRQGRRDSNGPVTAAGDEGMNDSVFASPAPAEVVVQPIIRGRSASSGINGTSGQRSRQNSYTKPLNGSFTKLNSAFSNELIPRIPSRDSLTRRGSLGGDSTRRGGAELSSNESCPGGESPTPYHTPRTSRPPEIAQTATVRKPRRMKPPNEQSQTQQYSENIQSPSEVKNQARAKPGVRPSGRAMQSVRGMTHSSPAANMTPERMSSPAFQLNSPNSRSVPKTVVKDQTNRRLPKPDDVRDRLRSSRILSTPETHKKKNNTTTKDSLSDEEFPPPASSTSSLPTGRPLRALPNGTAALGLGLPIYRGGLLSSQDSLNSACSSARSEDSLSAASARSRATVPLIPPPLPPRQRMSMIVPPKARKSQMKKRGQEAPSAVGSARRTIPKRPNDGSVPNLSSNPNSQSATRHSSPQVKPSQGKPTQSKVTSRQSDLSASTKMVASSSTGSLSQRSAGASDPNSTMPLQRSSQMSRSSNLGRSGGDAPLKQSRASHLPTAKTSAIPGPRSAAKSRRQLPQVPTDSEAPSENYQPQISSNPPSIPFINTEEKPQRRIYAPYEVTELSDRSQTSTQRSSVQSSDRSAFRLVKPIAQRPNQSQPNAVVGVGNGGAKELPYSSAPAQVTVVGQDSILPLKYLIPAHERDSPSLLDVYSGDEIFDGNDISISQWDDGCY